MQHHCITAVSGCLPFSGRSGQAADRPKGRPGQGAQSSRFASFAAEGSWGPFLLRRLARWKQNRSQPLQAARKVRKTKKSLRMGFTSFPGPKNLQAPSAVSGALRRRAGERRSSRILRRLHCEAQPDGVAPVCPALVKAGKRRSTDASRLLYTLTKYKGKIQKCTIFAGLKGKFSYFSPAAPQEAWQVTSRNAGGRSRSNCTAAFSRARRPRSTYRTR